MRSPHQSKRCPSCITIIAVRATACEPCLAKRREEAVARAPKSEKTIPEWFTKALYADPRSPDVQAVERLAASLRCNQEKRARDREAVISVDPGYDDSTVITLHERVSDGVITNGSAKLTRVTLGGQDLTLAPGDRAEIKDGKLTYHRAPAADWNSQTLRDAQQQQSGGLTEWAQANPELTNAGYEQQQQASQGLADFFGVPVHTLGTPEAKAICDARDRQQLAERRAEAWERYQQLARQPDAHGADVRQAYEEWAVLADRDLAD